jgi:hypothetical protein
MKLKIFFSLLIILTLSSCSIPVDTAPPPTALPTASPQPALIVPPTFTPTPVLSVVEGPALTQPPAPTQTQLPAPTVSLAFCDDPRGRELINSFSKAIASKDGPLLASLVSPSSGMDVRIYRNGNVVTYDAEHAKFVFETTFQADWGLSFGSGESTLGSFQEIILPSLQQVFTSNAVLVCNQIKVGGATYQALWPYAGMNYYSVHFPGTDQNSGLDWQTWAVGMDNAAGKFYLSALVHFEWEP